MSVEEMAAFEKELLLKEPTPAQPVGLRYDRLEEEGLLRGEQEDGEAVEGGIGTPRQVRTAGAERSEDIGETEGRVGTPGTGEATGIAGTAGISETSRWYFLCNAWLVSRLLARCRKLLVACEETRPEELSGHGQRKIVRVCLKSSPLRSGATPDETAGDERRSDTRQAGDERRSDTRRAGLGGPSGGSVVRVERYDELPLEDGAVDGLLVDSSLLLGGDVPAGLREFGRVLEPGGTLCVLAVNWEHEMVGKSVSYETSFKRYGGDVYLGLVKRTLLPPEEVEYVCLLDSYVDLVRRMAHMRRDELRTLTLADVPGAKKHVLSVELMKIPQTTAASLEGACKEAGFRNVVVAGAPGVLARRFAAGLSPTFERIPASRTGDVLPGPSEREALMEEACRAFAHSFPFVSVLESPHLVAVGLA